MAGVTLKKVSKYYLPNIAAVRDFSLEIADGEFVALVGPSGCGKSTVLRMVAGLEEITSGELFIDGKLTNGIKTKDRNISFVFQSYALYPHMTVFQNMSFCLKVRKICKAEIFDKVDFAAGLLGIKHLLDRKPGALSGGERQRVAIGRAIVRNSSVFLFDEPLSNLDARLKLSMRKELADLHKKLGATFIYVTHDPVEALTMADKIVVMESGAIQEVGTPLELLRSKSDFMADFIRSWSSQNLDLATPL